MLHRFSKKIEKFVAKVHKSRNKTFRELVIRLLKEVILFVVVLGARVFLFLEENWREIAVGVIIAVVSGLLIPNL